MSVSSHECLSPLLTVNSQKGSNLLVIILYFRFDWCFIFSKETMNDDVFNIFDLEAFTWAWVFLDETLFYDFCHYYVRNGSL